MDVFHERPGDPNTPPSWMIAVNPAYLWMETFSWYTCGHTCSIVLVGSNYLVGWNDCTKSKLMKKFTSWDFGTHKCILGHDLVKTKYCTYNQSHVEMPKESTWWYSKDLVNFKQFDEMVIVSADVHSMKLILIWWQFLFLVVTQKCCLKLGGSISTDV